MSGIYQYVIMIFTKKNMPGIVSLLLSVYLFLIPHPANSQIIRDSSAIKLIRKGMNHIYNLEFDSARHIMSEINKTYPEHPVIYLYRGLLNYWENFPLVPDSPERKSYEDDMNKTISLCEMNSDTIMETEYLLADLCARGLLLLFYADNGLSREVIPLATSTYKYLRKSFNFTSRCSDFYYFTGLYNYYREAYPRVHPVYKVISFMFPRGDIARGLNELEFAARTSIVLRAESYSMLSWIWLHFENDYQKALDYCKILHDLYPDNVLFRSMYIKNLLLLKQYDKSEEIISASGQYINPYFNAQVNIFNGLLQEKKYRNYDLARQYYQKGIDLLSEFGTYGDEYAAYGYFGLSRICDLTNDKKGKRLNRRNAMDLTDFKKVNFDN
jgi:tetratricopeptide (TPR) repeat protein